MRYRPEIDGLRALAVIAVVLFHVGFEAFRGGFVGVDVFFVISVFLITSILLEDIMKNRFSLLDFYERRARRILPGLFLVLAFSIPLSWAYLMPNEHINFSNSLISTSLFFPIYFFERTRITLVERLRRCLYYIRGVCQLRNNFI